MPLQLSRARERLLGMVDFAVSYDRRKYRFGRTSLSAPSDKVAYTGLVRRNARGALTVLGSDDG
jgi:hypothetical protein